MESNPESKVNRKTMWLLFLVSTIATVGLLIFNPTWFWVPLPFMLTYLVYAMDVV